MKDELNRLLLVTNLTNILETINLDNGIVLGIDADWGKGKTTFLNIWEDYLLKNKKDDYNIIKFNAWENDDSENPLISLIVELEDLLLGETKKELYGFVKELSKRAVPNFIERITCGVIKAEDLNSLIQAHETLRYDSIENEKTRRELKKKIKDSISKLSEDKKIIFFIDELDRCRPLYAIELLETVKHLFNIKNCIFILAWDKTQLSHSIKTVYGNEMDSTGYLRRFIDLDYQLPTIPRDVYIKYLIEKEKISNSKYPTFFEILPTISTIYDLSLRDLDKLIFSLSIHFSKIDRITLKDTNEYIYSLLTALFSIIRIKNSDLYLKIRDKKYNFEEIKSIMQEMKSDKLQQNIVTKLTGIDEMIPSILHGYLCCNIEHLDSIKEYILFNTEGWRPEHEVNMRYFCSSDRIFGDIDFLNDLKI